MLKIITTLALASTADIAAGEKLPRRMQGLPFDPTNPDASSSQPPFGNNGSETENSIFSDPTVAPTPEVISFNDPTT